jgi:pSer/pThr/pTyr-binding forkhead associated (FHA) protein
MLELTIISESGQALRKLELARGTSIKIGRARECDIRVTAPTVSRHHAEVVDDGEEWTFRDTDSTHGSLVKGQKVREIAITPGLEVRIGPVLLRFDNLASRIGRELDLLLDEDDALAGPVSVEIIGRDGRHTTTLDETVAHWTPGTPSASQPSPVQARKLRRSAVDRR